MGEEDHYRERGHGGEYTLAEHLDYRLDQIMAALADILTAEQTTESGEITALTAAYQAALGTITSLQATIASGGLSPADQATVDAIAAAQAANEAALTAAIPAVTTPVTSPVVTPVAPPAPPAPAGP